MSADPYAEELVAEVQRPTRLKVRCGNCGRLLAEKVTAPWVIKCSRCKCVNESAPTERSTPSLSPVAAQRVEAARQAVGSSAKL